MIKTVSMVCAAIVICAGVTIAHAESTQKTKTPANTAPAATKVEVCLGVEDSWRPYANKQGKGLSTDIVKAAFAAVGQKVSISVRPYARVLRDLEAGILDGGYNVTRQASTEKRFVFGQHPILTASASFYYASNTSDYTADPAKSYATAKDIPNKARVASIIDYEYGDVYESQRKRFQEVRVVRQQQIIRMLLAHRVDVGIMFDRVAEYTLADMKLPESVLSRGAVNHTSDIYVAFSRKSPNAEKYAVLLDKGLEEIRANGVYDDLMRQFSIKEP